jgi:hypothetical protein
MTMTASHGHDVCYVTNIEVEALPIALPSSGLSGVLMTGFDSTAVHV